MQALRQSLRTKRQSITNSDRDKFARRVLSQSKKIKALQRNKKIAIYLTNNNEIDTKYILNFLKKNKFNVYLPILFGKKLKFAKIGKKFKTNKFNIKEPISTQILAANKLNIIFMPLVGFDKDKNRLGMGGGFYDRTLAFKKRRINYQNPKLIGLAFDLQQVDKLEAKSWDVPLDRVITPTKIY